MAIDKQIYNFINVTKRIQLMKLGSKLPENLDLHMQNIETYKATISKDQTKTQGKKVLMLAEKAEKETMKAISALDSEFKSNANRLDELELVIDKATSFKGDITELMLATRYADAIQDKSTFLGMVSNDFQAARMVVKDPLTRTKFKIKEEDPIYKMAQKTTQLHALGDKRFEEYNQCRTKHSVLIDLGQHMAQTIDNITAVSAAY